MSNKSAIFDWLDHLRELMPVSHLVVIGAGAGTGMWVHYLRNKNYKGVTLVEADHHQFRHLQRALLNHPEWHARQQLIAPKNGPTIFYEAGLSSESGILKPEVLRGVWANLEIGGQRTLEAVTLERLLTDLSLPVNWLVIDCLPALAILASAGASLDGVQIIAARIVFDELADCSESAHLGPLSESLENRHFRFLTVDRCRNPGIGYALFVRDSEASIRQLGEQLTESAREVVHLKAELAELKFRYEQQSAEAASIEAQVDFLKEALM